jgi:hypothetical protein
LIEGCGDEAQHAAALLSAGFDNRQHRLHEAVAAVALRAETQLTPDHTVTEVLSNVVF